MTAFIVRRLLLSIPTLLGVLIVAFLLLFVAPGDPVQAMVGERADEETIARLRAELRLDDPLYVQFGHYLGGVVKGDLGRSWGGLLDQGGHEDECGYHAGSPQRHGGHGERLEQEK